MSENSKPETVTFFRKRKDLHALKEKAAKANSAKDKAGKLSEEKRLVRMKNVNLKLTNFGGVKPLLVIRTKLYTNSIPLYFLKSTPENLELLRTIQPFVEFGLIYKRGTTISSGRAKPLSSNIMVEEHLGANGLICLEDLVHEIATVGPNFEVVSNFLAPFNFGTVKDKEVDVTRIISTIKDRATPEQKSKAINQLVSQLN
ncbi:60S ribosomal protein L7-like 1 [Entomophthora muscae]|uniref:60S ribosomal protein L7-like 1 n=1 Tax=Entomophthora muscae TaxID=34485 RepID=A0ACC2SKV0_9FUNG|nr:60S ribosomal protein L7-like 1 [Entomophthora muscae]